MVEEDDEFAHHGGERDFLELAGGEQALIKRFEDAEAGKVDMGWSVAPVAIRLRRTGSPPDGPG